MTTGSTHSISPIVTFTDLDAGIEMLIQIFGCETEVLFRDDNGVAAHVELRWGQTILMPSLRVEDKAWSLGPSSFYLTVDEPDVLHDRLVLAGLEVVLPLTDQDYGSRDFAVRDFSDNVWVFGTYKPGAGQ